MSRAEIIDEGAKIIEGEARCLRQSHKTDGGYWRDERAKTDHDHLIKTANQLRQIADDIKGERHADTRKR